jgi:hypothetical protein
VPERRFASEVRYALSLDGVHAAWPVSFEGGDAVGDVVEVADGSDPVVRKHLGGVHYSDIDVQCGADATVALLEWISAALSNSFVPKSGAVSAVDANATEIWRLEFSHALISRLSLPTLDGSSKEAMALRLTMTPELTRRLGGSGSKLKTPASKAQKGWLASNFRLAIGNLDASRVVRIDPIDVRISRPELAVGERRMRHGASARVDVSNLVVILAEASADTWWAWHEDFLINGNNGADRELDGTLELLGPDRSVLLGLTLRGLGLISLSRPAPASTSGFAALRAEMYCEEVALTTPT